ncbi:DUF4031 domain-containing protein [Arthrobacter sp. Sa2BUA2]|uniref:DUF4031 domain-containing protein n=1 Tax=Arthrobacter pullicola TaxID=2762224 RepID=A0ABR8YE24_9MICC|nr:DUF4031 domain-containing protein [Arthrobacter pullicola]MBD8042472.1 DUF4031 domain-containing protein [Arthrobacter pullicola]
MIYIDPPLWPAHNTYFSHLVSDTSLEELHAFAGAAGIPRRAFDQDHYDVPAHRYRDLVNAGAAAVDGATLVRALIAGGLRIPARERAASLVHPLRRRWEAMLPGTPELGAELLNRWGEPHRRYHDRRHLLQTLEALHRLGCSDRPVLLAAWFHDAVYDGVPGTDEEASAVLAEQLLPAAGVSRSETAETARLVRLTAGHDPDPGDISGALLSDADLAVLGRGAEGYDRYAADVRLEYRHFDDEAFRAGRRAVLDALLGRTRLFRTARGEELWGAAARANLRRELAALSASGDPAGKPRNPRREAGPPRG